MSRLPKLDVFSKEKFGGLNTFYRGWFAYNVTGLIYIFTFMKCNAIGVQVMRQKGLKEWSISIKNRLVI